MTERVLPDLVPLSGYALPVLVSPGTERRSQAIAEYASRAFIWLCGVTGKHPQLTLYIASRQDWDAVAYVPIFGMPQSVPAKVITSAEPADWWQEYVDVLRPHLSAASRTAIARAYGDPPDYTALADLIVVHELTHIFHDIDPVTWASEFPADWVMELFANIGLYGYLAVHDTTSLILLSAMANATAEAGAHIWPMTDLDLMGQSMQASTTNYVWYEFMLIRWAESIWNTGGEQAIRDFQDSLGDPTLDRDEIVRRLAAIDTGVAESVLNWPNN